MKRTDIERRDRELKRQRKKEEAQDRREDTQGSSGFFAENLYKLFFYNEEKIYNIKQSKEILALLMEMENQMAEKDFDNAIRKAIRMTKVKMQKLAFDEIKALLV